MASLAAKLASAAEIQRPKSCSGGNEQLKGAQQSDNDSRPRALRRNMQFSPGSHLVVLRDDEGSRNAANLHRSSNKSTDLSQESTSRSVPQQRNVITEPDLLQKRPRHMAFHDGIQRELEARSALYAKRNSNLTPPPVSFDNDPNPPAFFRENFPIPLRSRHEASEHREETHLCIDSLTSVSGKGKLPASGAISNPALSPSIDSSSSQNSIPDSLKTKSSESNGISPTTSLRSLAPGPRSLDSSDPLYASTLRSLNMFGSEDGKELGHTLEVGLLMTF
ncbi:hypothetical protein MYAM1_002045 [Malassezia yamatoensis]|uniref:Uncharacterized protein n=1 Tax=Malassezia yamatoensis TaxID=253288 RepID=A0AAJ5YT43_9BASI|nr:hypothetical protein MYAM1_002045 [Malassezia yamatoensis]